jgi:hypothetical protein
MRKDRGYLRVEEGHEARLIFDRMLVESPRVLTSGGDPEL